MTTRRKRDIERERGISLAADALQAAMAEDYGRAKTAIVAINDELGGEGLTLAIVAWSDTLVAQYRKATGTPDDAPVRMAWQDADTGDISATGNDVSPEVRWAGQVVAARAALDKAGFNALLRNLPRDGWAIGGYVSALLNSVSLTLCRLAEAQS